MPTSKQKGRNIHHESKNKNKNKQKTNNESNLGFKMGMLGSLFQRKKQTLRKEKAKQLKNKLKNPPQMIFSNQGTKKMEF